MSLHSVPDPADSTFGFSPPHIAYFEARKIPLVVAHALGARSMTRTEVALALNRDLQRTPSGGLAICYTQAPNFWRVRMDVTDEGKFLTPGGMPVRPYLPQGHLIAPEIWTDPTVDLAFAEGPWKAVALSAAGIPTIGLAGCSAGGHDKGKKDTEEKLVLHPDLLSIEWKRRKVIILMDAGRAWNPDVLNGENMLARCLINAGARVWIAKLPPRGGIPRKDQGPDDFLADQGAVALRQVMADATKWNPADADDKGQFARLAEELRAMKNDSGAVCLPVRTNGPGKLGWNEMIGVPTIDEELVGDADVARLRLHFSDRGQSFKTDDLWSALVVVAQESPYHPVRRYLDSLKWDGVERIKLLATEVLHLSVEAAPKDGEPLTAEAAAKRKARADREFALNQKLIRCFLVSAVRRAQKPGSKVDTALILKGVQGTLKSTFFRELAGEQWFCDSDLDIGDQRSTPMVMGMAWICEMPELESLKRAREQTQVKAFLSRAVDLYRPPYGRAVVSHPRSSIIVGTTNEDSFLTDVSGNRRWHVVVVSRRIDIGKLKAWRDQLWAETMVAYGNGEAHWLSEAEEDLLAEVQEQHFVEHPWSAAVVRWLHDNQRRPAPVIVTTEAVLTEALDREVGAITKNDEMAVAGILRKLKWTKTRIRKHGQRAWVWSPPTDWTWAPPTSDADDSAF